MDYKKLLLAYMNHVGEMEGTYFLGHSADTGITGLTQQEVNELRSLTKESEVWVNSEGSAP